MKKRISSFFTDESVRVRALRGAGLMVVKYGAANGMRLVSNLILTRLLFPEVFGLMALVQIFISGLQMFSDIGIRTSVIQSKRGDDRAFLDTAWTLQVARGVLLWLGACALAWPAAQIYDEPMLMMLLPIVGLNAVIAGFTTTNVMTANRHLRLGRQTFINLGCQALGIVITVVLAYYLRSVWALVFGGIVSAIIQRILLQIYIPGAANRFHLEKDAVREIVTFGKFIFLSTLSGFMISHADRAILGGFVPISDLGIYAVGSLLGGLPLTLGRAISTSVVFPLYRMKPPAKSAHNRKQIFKARRMVITFAFLGALPMAYGGPWLIDLLYDDRYTLAGPIVTLMCLGVIPQLVFAGYGGVLLANGDSRRHFILLMITAVIQTAYLYYGIKHFGLFGAVVGAGLASLTTYPLRSYFVSKYKANDNLGDAGFILLGAILFGGACWLHWDKIVLLAG